MSTAAMEGFATERTAEVLGMLATMLSRRLDRPCRVRAVDHRPSSVRSSFAIEDIDVLLGSGELLRLVHKTLGPRGVLPTIRMAKPLFLHDPLREIEAYQHLLEERPHLGTAKLYSSVVEPSHDRFWLLCERVPGVELHRVANLETWRTVARWLAALHTELAPLSDDRKAPGTRRLLRYDPVFIRMWIARALTTVRVQNPPVPPHLLAGLEWLASRYETVVDRLTAMPATIIHGEFYASNILMRHDPSLPRVCVVDWDMVAAGPPLLDLAALLAAEPDEQRRDEIASAYYAARTASSPRAMSRGDFLEDLAYCRLHLAIQWLGWSPDISPPKKESHRWLEDALRLAEELPL